MIYLIEGPDGGGKTTLVNSIVEKNRGTQLLRRASTSLGGPIDNHEYLEWTVNTLPFLSESRNLFLLDRHPLISEMIYGPILRGKPDMGRSPSTYYQAMKVLKDHVSSVILCLPPISVVQENIYQGDQLDGVTSHIEEIYQGYMELFKSEIFPNVMIYDYTVETDAQAVSR